MTSSEVSAMAPDFDPRRAIDERGGRAAGDRAVGDAAGQRVGAQHPHGAAEEIARLDLEPVGARLALAEGLERGQALDRIEELGGKARIGALAELRVADVELIRCTKTQPLPPQRSRLRRGVGIQLQALPVQPGAEGDVERPDRNEGCAGRSRLYIAEDGTGEQDYGRMRHRRAHPDDNVMHEQQAAAQWDLWLHGELQ